MYKSRILPTGGFFLPVPVLVDFHTSSGVLPVLSTFLRGALRALHPPCSELGGDYTLPSARGGLPRIVTREVLPDEAPALRDGGLRRGESHPLACVVTMVKTENDCSTTINHTQGGIYLFILTKPS